MKIQSCLAMGLLAVAAAGPLQAQDPTVQIRASESRVTLQRGEFKDYSSNYLLSNGRYIKFVEYGKRYYAKLDGAEYTEMYPTDRAVFTTALGARMEFREQGDEVTISGYETLPLAGVSTRNTTLLARR